MINVTSPIISATEASLICKYDIFINRTLPSYDHLTVVIIMSDMGI